MTVDNPKVSLQGATCVLKESTAGFPSESGRVEERADTHTYPLTPPPNTGIERERDRDRDRYTHTERDYESKCTVKCVHSLLLFVRSQLLCHL